MPQKRAFWLFCIGYWHSQGLCRARIAWSKCDHHGRIAEPQQGWVSPAAAPPCVPGARFITSAGWAGTAPASSCSVPLFSYPLPLSISVSLGVAYSAQWCYLPFLLGLNGQLTSQGPVSANGSSNLLTILYHEYTQPCSPRLWKTKPKDSVLTHSSNSLASPSAKSCFPNLSALAIIFIVLFYRASQEKPLCLKEGTVIWRETPRFICKYFVRQAAGPTP